MRSRLLRPLEAFDLVLMGYLAITGCVAGVMRAPGWGYYVAAHAAACAGILTIARLSQFQLGLNLYFIRHWYVLAAILGCFREMHYLIPAVNPFQDGFWDWVLGAIDQRLFGDVNGVIVNNLPAAAADILHLCYWFYFPSMIIPAAILYSKLEMDRFRSYTTVLVTGFALSYLGYFLVPALGPHVFLNPRPEVLDGLWVGAFLHQALMTLELRMPDAFPSGHALMSGLVLIQVHRHLPKAFPWIAAPSIGCILATVLLRYHYVVDVLASALLLPTVLVLSESVERTWNDWKREGHDHDTE